MYTLTFFSNYFNHHQRALCDAWGELLGEGFCFVETEPMEGFRVDMGWGVEETPPYVLRTYESPENHETAVKLGRDSDIVVIGTAPEDYVRERLSLNKLTFRYTERPMKEGVLKMFVPRLARKFYDLHYQNRDRNLLALCASAYASEDYRKLRSYPGKCLKFGYFPQVPGWDPDKLMEGKRRGAPRILSAGRLLRLKRVDLLIRAAAGLAREGYDFEVDIIGSGEEEGRLREMAARLLPDGRVRFLGSVSPQEVRSAMERANIFTVTSNFLEGWGSVVYEGLAAGCAVAASHGCGSAPWLVKDGDTGLLFESGNAGSLKSRIQRFLREPEFMESCGRRAYEQMAGLWNPENAAANVLKVSESLLTGEIRAEEAGFVVPEGPCSSAPCLKNNWYRKSTAGGRPEGL